VDSATSAAPTDPEEFWDHDLVGLSVVTATGEPVGTVTEVVHTSAQDLLVVERETGTELLVPFVAELVPTVDLTAAQVVIAPPPGLLDEQAD
jgi:16S rRNA processing protein RimM